MIPTSAAVFRQLDTAEYRFAGSLQHHTRVHSETAFKDKTYRITLGQHQLDK